MNVRACWIESGGGERAGKLALGAVVSGAVRRGQQLMYRSATLSGIAIPHEPRVAFGASVCVCGSLPPPAAHNERQTDDEDEDAESDADGDRSREERERGSDGGKAGQGRAEQRIA